jgi:septum formation inhibitor MinC
MRLLKPLAPAVLAASLVLAGCGSGSSGSGAVSAKAQTALQPFLEAVRQAAASGNRNSVAQAVRQLKHEVQVERSGISASRQAAIDNAADAVLNDIHSQSPSTSPTPTQTETTPPPPTTPPATVTITPPATVTVSPPVTSVSPSDTSTSSGEGDGGDG